MRDRNGTEERRGRKRIMKRGDADKGKNIKSGDEVKGNERK